MHILPFKTATAHENMALDSMLLEDYPQADAPRFRAYGWSKPSWSFGYSQPWSQQHDLIMQFATDVVRRPTGGGLVDHLEDWTYALVIPKSAPLCREKPIDIYRQVHEALGSGLIDCGCDVHLEPCERTCVLTSGETTAAKAETAKRELAVCFERPEPFDVVTAKGAKVAGAAQKRNRHGLLVQGSISRQSLGNELDWAAFTTAFTKHLAALFVTEPEQVSFPRFDNATLRERSKHFSSMDWNKRR